MDSNGQIGLGCQCFKDSLPQSEGLSWLETSLCLYEGRLWRMWPVSCTLLLCKGNKKAGAALYCISVSRGTGIIQTPVSKETLMPRIDNRYEWVKARLCWIYAHCHSGQLCQGHLWCSLQDLQPPDLWKRASLPSLPVRNSRPFWKYPCQGPGAEDTGLAMAEKHSVVLSSSFKGFFFFFSFCTRNLSSGPRACVASTFTAEPSSYSCFWVLFFWCFFLLLFFCFCFF